jgi:hypothetical protein
VRECLLFNLLHFRLGSAKAHVDGVEKHDTNASNADHKSNDESSRVVLTAKTRVGCAAKVIVVEHLRVFGVAALAVLVLDLSVRPVGIPAHLESSAVKAFQNKAFFNWAVTAILGGRQSRQEGEEEEEEFHCLCFSYRLNFPA